MTATELQSLIAGVLVEHWTFTTHGDFDALVDRCDGCHANIYTHGHATDQKTAWAAHQARAVLAALTEAGTVEWGSEHVRDRGIDFHDWANEETARRKVAYYGGRVVSGSCCHGRRWGNNGGA